MNLVIDIGNTKTKLAVFQRNKIIFKSTGDLQLLLKDCISLKAKLRTIDKAIIASVGNLNEEILIEIEKLFKVLILDYNTKLPFQNNYKTPKTLGVDRLALVSASVKQYPKRNVLIIDAGTCITYDFINAENRYLGGAISPGIRLRYRSLNNLTANLPLLDTKVPENIIGNSSIESIHSGVINGVLMEIEGAVQQYENKFEDLTVILTGGDADFLSKRLKSSIFANSNFLLEGLNFILEFNKK